MELRVGDKVIEVERARLRKWFALEDIRENLRMAAESGDLLSVSELVCAYLSAASSEGKETFESAPWQDVVYAYAGVTNLNSPRKRFPIFSDTVSRREEDQPWDYKGRGWFTWVHMLASSYGWSLDEISNLEIEDGIALIQEVMVQRQLDREWEWSRTEIAYVYEPASKKSVFKPLKRPVWMVERKEIKVTKLRKDMLPVGVIENLSGMGLHGQLVH